MQEPITRKLFLGFVQLHILHHAKKEPFFGSWMIAELKTHGYQISAGTLYPILHSLSLAGMISVENRLEEGKVRKYYAITLQGEAALKEATEMARELVRELGINL